MSVILLVVGIVVAAAGIAAIGFGIPINEFTLGTTLIIAGTTALTGGLVLIGLSVVIAELARVADGLRARPATRPPARASEARETVVVPAAPAVDVVAASQTARGRPAVTPAAARAKPEAPLREVRPPEPPPVAVPSAVEVSAAAIERLRSSIPRADRPRAEPSPAAGAEDAPLSPEAGYRQQAPQPHAPGAEPAPLGPEIKAEDRAEGAAVEALKASRLDFLFRSRSGRPAPEPESFDSIWPADGRSGRTAGAEPEARVRVDQVERQSGHAPPVVQQPAAEAPPAEEPRAVAILKSGVVDGMAYTLFADGSIEAKLPHGTVRFGSIAELRAHIESNS